jgi:hypothetical protein
VDELDGGGIVFSRVVVAALDVLGGGQAPIGEAVDDEADCAEEDEGDTEGANQDPEGFVTVQGAAYDEEGDAQGS